MDTFVRSLTPVGRAVATLGPVALVIAALSGWREFSVIGVGAVVAILVGLAWIARPQPIGVTRTLHPPKVTVGESSRGVVSVKNTTRRRIGSQVAEDVLGDRVVSLAIPALRPDQVVEEHYVVPARVRGLFDVGPVRLARTDPLGLFRRIQGQGSVEQLWVRPRVHLLPPLSSGWARDLDGPTSDVAPRGSAAFHALREYQFGDDLRHVHWRTSARTGQLMVRHFVDTRRTQELVLLDPRAEVFRDGSFDEAVDAAASICAGAEANGREVSLLLPAQVAMCSDVRLHFLDRLALVKVAGGLNPGDASAGFRSTTASALVIVTGDADPQPLLQQGRRLLRSGLIVVVRLSPGAEPSFRATAGGRIVTAPSAARLAGPWAEAIAR